MSAIWWKASVDGEHVELGYENVLQLLRDAGLRSLFEENLVETCEVYAGGKLAFKMPIASWPKFQENVISNSVQLLRATEAKR